MKTSNKILTLAVSIFVLSYMANLMVILYNAKAEITKPYTLSGKTETINKYLGDNNSISLEGNLNVIIKKDTVNRAEIIGDKNLLSLLNISEEYNEFNVYSTNANYRNASKDIIKIILHLKSFAYLMGYDKVSFKTDTIINTDNFNINLWVYSTARLQLNTKLFSCTSGYHSSCNVSGKADDAVLRISKESSLEAKGLSIDNCNANLNSYAKAELNVTGSISEKISKNSSLNVTGNPKVN
jgi:hypothetical protein